jgi:hypothetical protein
VIAYPTTAPLVLNHRLAEPIRGFCKQGVRGSSPLGSTAGQRPFLARREEPLSRLYPSEVLQYPIRQPDNCSTACSGFVEVQIT